jgi:hypothetical protein
MDAPGQQQLSPAEEQEKWLQDAFKAVKQAAFYMRRALVRARLLCAQRLRPWSPCCTLQRRGRAIAASSGSQA